MEIVTHVFRYIVGFLFRLRLLGVGGHSDSRTWRHPRRCRPEICRQHSERFLGVGRHRNRRHRLGVCLRLPAVGPVRLRGHSGHDRHLHVQQVCAESARITETCLGEVLYFPETFSVLL